ncbi:hypothetical protein [Salsuginibacillus kocurii]|uniref:hypothetical protein n=1 Tax=Salsuginibacillus kocurii TaxID=427078 RepID=UPI00035E24EB|nr:hypothetical protein [Salsuginibacillus kocurii]
MEFIVFIHGDVKHTITIDPTVWIFDERKVDLTTYFQEDRKDAAQEEEIASVAKRWEKERTEGSNMPEKHKTNEIRSKKEALLEGSFGIEFTPFLENSEPSTNASSLIIETEHSEHKLSLDEGSRLIIGFSSEGKPLYETGPVHAYYGDGSNQSNPITHVKGFRIE